MTPEEKAKYYGVPLIPKRDMPKPVNPHGVKAICGECGLELRGVMGYCCPKANCPKANCPTGLGPITSASLGDFK